MMTTTKYIKMAKELYEAGKISKETYEIALAEKDKICDYDDSEKEE